MTPAREARNGRFSIFIASNTHSSLPASNHFTFLTLIVTITPGMGAVTALVLSTLPAQVPAGEQRELERVLAPLPGASLSPATLRKSHPHHGNHGAGIRSWISTS